MPTLYVENVPEDLYSALRNRARERRRSIAAEVLSLLEENIPTKKGLKDRQAALRKLEALQFTRSVSRQSVPTSAEMVREDRDR